jgi:hypothetical protein
MKRLWVILLFNFLIAAIFSLGAFSAFFSVRTAIMWYAINKSDIQNRDFNSYDVFNALNEYRKSKGIAPVEFSSDLCNNLGARWVNYKNTDSHAGLDEWVAKEIPGIQVTEVLGSGRTAKETIEKLSGSQGHDNAMKTKKNACVYTAENLSVIMFSN